VPVVDVPRLMENLSGCPQAPQRPVLRLFQQDKNRPGILAVVLALFSAAMVGICGIRAYMGQIMAPSWGNWCLKPL